MESGEKKKDTPKILIVDDISINVEILENIIQAEGYEAYGALSVQEALDIMNETKPDLILSDCFMPGMSGMEFCKLLKSNARTRDIPFIFITVGDSSEEKKEAFSVGAADFIPKPIERIEVVMRVNNQLSAYKIKKEMEDYNRMMHGMVIEQKKQMEREQENVLLALAKVIEKRSSHTEGHLGRLGYNCRMLAQSLQLLPEYEDLITDEFIETIETASKLHDIGLIALPESMKLDEAADNSPERQREIDSTHTKEGAEILKEIKEGGSTSRFLDMAIQIAAYHHAHWDGSGSPADVRGEEIPISARIVAIVNDFDAFLGKKDGREPLSPGESARKIQELGGTLYDPYIAEVFQKILKQLKTG